MSQQHLVRVEHQPIQVLVHLRIVDQLADRAVAIVERMGDVAEDP